MTKKLPVFAAIRHMLLLSFNNLGQAFRITWAWMVVFVVTIAMFIWIIAGVDIATPSASDLVSLAVVFVFLIAIALMATASIAVAWHRYILLDEGGNVAFNLRIDGLVWRYVGNALAIGIVGLVLIGVPIVVSMQVSELAILLVFPLLLLLAPILYRMSIKLPAVALERRDFRFSDGFDASAGNYWPLVGLAAVYVLVAIVINIAVAIVTFVGLIFGPLAVVVQVLATALAEWFGIVFGISLLTTLYGFFVEGRSFDD
ncbi:MAG: hypothetical protein HKN11_07495 [Rhizobiales bacterium]|nr:hypothetical protein [Hyphomicrobiales bacterium]